MKIKSYTKGDIAILEPSGKLMGGADVGELDEKLYGLLGRQQKKVIVDLAKTTWITSSAISVLIHHHTKFIKIGGRLKLANLTNKIQQILVISKLTLVFDVYDSLDEAMGNFEK